MSSGKPLVSVIIPSYNQSQFLSYAIESVLAQTVQDVEIIVIDDGSTDNSPDISREYATRYSEKIKYFEHPHHKNRGLGATRNLGIRHAEGKYIAFLDSDDLWSPVKLERQIRILDAYPEVGFVYCSLTVIDKQGQPTSERYGRQTMGEGIAEQLNQAFDSIVGDSLFIGLGSTVIARKHTIFQVGLFAEDVKYCYEDSILAGKIAYFYPIYWVAQPLAQYRVHDSSVTMENIHKQRWKKVRFRVIRRIYRDLRQLSPEIDTQAFRIRLANLCWKAYKRHDLTIWGFYRLLFDIFPYRSANLSLIKIFATLILGHAFVNKCQRLFHLSAHNNEHSI